MKRMPRDSNLECSTINSVAMRGMRGRGGIHKPARCSSNDNERGGYESFVEEMYASHVASVALPRGRGRCTPAQAIRTLVSFQQSDLIEPSDPRVFERDKELRRSVPPELRQSASRAAALIWAKQKDPSSEVPWTHNGIVKEVR